MSLNIISAMALIGGAVLTVLCVLSHYPDPHAVIQGTETIEASRIGEVALCGAPLGLGFIFAVIVALAGQ